MGRLGTADDIAGVVGFLASGDSGWITGQYIEASGGYQLVMPTVRVRAVAPLEYSVEGVKRGSPKRKR